MALVKWRRSQCHESKPLQPIVSNGFDAVVVKANPSVGVSDSDVEREVVVESVGGVGEIELGESGISDEEFRLFLKEDQPEYEEGEEGTQEDAVEQAEGVDA